MRIDLKTSGQVENPRNSNVNKTSRHNSHTIFRKRNSYKVIIVGLHSDKVVFIMDKIATNSTVTRVYVVSFFFQFFDSMLLEIFKVNFYAHLCVFYKTQGSVRIFIHGTTFVYKIALTSGPSQVSSNFHSFLLPQAHRPPIEHVPIGSISSLNCDLQYQKPVGKFIRYQAIFPFGSKS